MLRTRSLSRIHLGSLLVLVALYSACRRAGPPYSPREDLKTIKIENGFRVELFASEPLIKSPVAMDIDENGKIYVVEMPGYPLDTRPTGRVVALEDTNGDGRPDRSTVFVDGLVMPDGVMHWKKGILVTSAPDVWYFGDTNGDGKAEVRQKILTGFAFTNPQHMVNGPVYGLDNWIYLAHQGFVNTVIFKKLFGDRGGDIQFADRDTPRLKMGRFGVRFRPDTHQLEALSGWSQFGQAFDEWGHHFSITNNNNGFHEVIAARYLERNPDLLSDRAMQDVSSPETVKVFPITHNPRFEMLTDVGTLTSACSITFPYLGGAFPQSFYHVAFIAEPAHNMVHCDVWSDSGATYAAKRLRDGAEFLASTDAWFRPVNFYVGPDGALYMIDYYRQVIEHPEWMAAETYHAKYIYNGQDMGRIYRIVPDTQPPIPLFKNISLGKATDLELVKQLSNPNIWWRRTAQRLLVDRQSADAVEPLIRLFQESPSPLARLHALWTLEGLGKLRTPLVEKALNDPEAGVRENAIRLTEPRLASAPNLVRKLLKMTGDPDPKVRFQLLCTLGFLDLPPVRTAQEKVLAEDIEDPWVQVAALSASSDRALQYFQTAVSRRAGFTGRESEGRTQFFHRVCSVIGVRQRRQEIRQILLAVAAGRGPESAWWRAACLVGLARGCQAKQTIARGTLKESEDLLLKVFQDSPPNVRHATLDLLNVGGLSNRPSVAKALKQAEATAADRKTTSEARADAVGLLALANPAARESFFERLIDPGEPDAVQIAAVRALGRIQGAQAGSLLLAKWRAMSPEVRTEATDALLRDPDRTRLLLNAVKTGEVQTWMLNSYRPQLFMARDEGIREMARALLEQNPAEREKVLKRYQTALDVKGDPDRGRQVFKKVCSKCHALDGVGVSVGPNLGTVRNHPVSELLVDILLPSKSIETGYETYVVERRSGGTVDGVMSAHTAATITLRQENARDTVIPRDDIRQMYVSNLSMMPEDLDKQVDVKQMADLLTYLTAVR